MGLKSKNLFRPLGERIAIDPTKIYFLSSGELATGNRCALYLYDANGNSLGNTYDISFYGFYWANGTRWYLGSDTTKLNAKIEFKGADRDKIAYLEWQAMPFDNVQLEEGSAATSYSPPVTDFSEVKVKTMGKNLVDITKPDYIPANSGEVINNNTYRVFANSSLAVSEYYYIYAPKGTKLTVSFDFELGGEATGKWFLANDNTGLNSGATWTVGDNGRLKISFGRTGGSGNNKLGWVDIKNLQVEVSSTPTTYEPYQGTEYTANADGTVDNVKSISPIMNILTNSQDVTINANYYVDSISFANDLKTSIINLGGDL